MMAPPPRSEARGQTGFRRFIRRAVGILESHPVLTGIAVLMIPAFAGAMSQLILAFGVLPPMMPNQRFTALEKGQREAMEATKVSDSSQDARIDSLGRVLGIHIDSMTAKMGDLSDLGDILGIKLCNEDGRRNPWIWAQLGCDIRLRGAPRPVR